MKTIMEPYEHSITVNNKKYIYTITPIDRNLIYFECKAAGISQKFLAKDVAGLLIDLPEFILEEIDYQKKQNEIIRFRISSEQKKEIQKRAIKEGYPTISAFMRALALNA